MAIETIKERMVVVWNDDGTFRGASLDERFVYEDDSTRNAQRPLTETEADDLIAQAVQLAHQHERLLVEIVERHRPLLDESMAGGHR